MNLKKHKIGKYEFLGHDSLELKPQPHKWRPKAKVKTGQTRYSTEAYLRNKWTAFCREAQKKGFDGLPFDAWMAVWNRADIRLQELRDQKKIDPPYNGEWCAWRFTNKHWATEPRCMWSRLDRKIGFVPGNTGVVYVEGPYHQYQRADLQPEALYWLAELTDEDLEDTGES